MADKKTLAYYQDHAGEFVRDTKNVSFGKVQSRFLEKLPKKGLILDFGCGSGRDSLAFLKAGYEVEAADGSPAMVNQCRASGMDARLLLFEDLKARDTYDGVWACSSLLHCSRDELSRVIPKVFQALKPGGWFYCSFKYGEFEGERNGRFFCDQTESSLLPLLKSAGFGDTEMWQSRDVRPGRSEQIWLNVLSQKKPL